MMPSSYTRYYNIIFDLRHTADVLERICMKELCKFEGDNFELTGMTRSRLCKNMPTLDLSSDTDCQNQCESLLESTPGKTRKCSHSRHSRSGSDRSRSLSTPARKRRDLCNCICQQGKLKLESQSLNIVLMISFILTAFQLSHLIH